VLALGCGVLAGTRAPASFRLSLASKNVATGGIGFSNAGGGFAPALRRAGYDHLVIHRRADRPVYLDIRDGAMEIREADQIWGCDVRESGDWIRRQVGNDGVEIGVVGPAGENLVRFAAIILGDARAAGRCGFGAVAFNTLHAGFSREDDSPPRRFFEEPIRTGVRAGAILNRREWDEMLDEYYRREGVGPADREADGRWTHRGRTDRRCARTATRGVDARMGSIPARWSASLSARCRHLT
jgi:aldehyde:ferredoxin oxidoreductase